MNKTRPVIIAGNWKMNFGRAETENFLSALEKDWESKLDPKTQEQISSGNIIAAVFPPYLSIPSALSTIRASGLKIEVGAQNVHWENSGAFTGEVSGPMIKELGLIWALTGHSERRQYFGETDETVEKRNSSLLSQGFKVIFCIGESKEERQTNQTEKILLRQLGRGLPKELAHHMNGRLIIAYEPIWAIGTGLTATAQQAEDAHQMIRKFLWDRFGMEASGKTPILYGGSVKPENINELLAGPNIDGALVGGASLKPESFLALINAASAKS